MQGDATRKTGPAGGVTVRIIWIAATFLLVAFVLFALISRLQQRQQINHRKAIQIAEYGLQTALQQFYKDPQPHLQIGRTAHRDGWYTVTAQRSSKGDSTLMHFKSTGRVGGISRTKVCVLVRKVTESDTQWTRKYIR
ncbi:MAG: hypothetical protein GF398_09530 [Chitinivibrionales bacterium]|nr:hypothetical protein [Chitinivibrionales bacterium]